MEEIKPNVFWVGAIDWNIRDFHGYETRFGTTYNSYLVKGEKVALIDTVKHGFEDELLEKLDELNVKDLDYLIVNHIEMDHAGCVDVIVERYPKVKIVTNIRGKNGLKDAYNIDHDTIIVKTGDKLNLGNKTLMFIETPLIHWPDSMMTYVVEDKLLISNDAFGMHYASERRYDDEFNDEEIGRIFFETAKYYANIILLYSDRVRKVLKEIKDMGLEFDAICPSHGIIWRKRVNEILSHYSKWSNGEWENRIVIAYDSMWNHTERAIHEITKGIEEIGVPFSIYKLRVSDLTEVMTEVMLSKGLIVGSPTLNREIFPSVAAFLTYMKGLKPFNKIAGAFGSYGWSGEAVEKIVNVFNQLKFDVVKSVRFKFSYEKVKEDLRNLGILVAEKVAMNNDEGQ